MFAAFISDTGTSITWARQSVLECGERRTCVRERQNIKLCYVYRVLNGLMS